MDHIEIGKGILPRLFEEFRGGALEIPFLALGGRDACDGGRRGGGDGLCFDDEGAGVDVCGLLGGRGVVKAERGEVEDGSCCGRSCLYC